MCLIRSYSYSLLAIVALLLYTNQTDAQRTVKIQDSIIVQNKIVSITHTIKRFSGTQDSFVVSKTFYNDAGKPIYATTVERSRDKSVYN